MNWKNIVDSFLDAFRMPNEVAMRLHHQLANYDAQAKQMRALSHEPLPIGDEYAMTLTAGSTLPYGMLYCTRVLDEMRKEVVFLALGKTTEQSALRARQLVSALDGARRL